MRTAQLCLMDAVGCGLLALQDGACRHMIGPVVPGATLPGAGARVFGTSLELDPVQAALAIGTLVRWLDFNDTWLAAEWGHPSDNFGAILAVADWLGRRSPATERRILTMADVCQAAIKAYEIQGVLALDNAFNRKGLDHVLLVRIASTAAATHLMGGTRQQVIDALSNAWIDGGCLRAYRHAPNTGSRKSWAAGDATSRGVRLALWTLAGEMGYPAALSAPKWGFCDAMWDGRPIAVSRPYGTYVIDQILFKIAYPAEFHAQTAVEAAISLSSKVRDRLQEIDSITLETQQAAVRIIDKVGPLHNPADRDHCLQYMVAVALLYGDLRVEHYRNETASDPRIDALRAKMTVVERADYTRDYLDPNKRAIPNAVTVTFERGAETVREEIHYPLGHQRRRDEALPMLQAKLERNIRAHLPKQQADQALAMLHDPQHWISMPVVKWMEYFVTV